MYFLRKYEAEFCMVVRKVAFFGLEADALTITLSSHRSFLSCRSPVQGHYHDEGMTAY
jgi:hypothetical protein